MMLTRRTIPLGNGQPVSAVVAYPDSFKPGSSTAIILAHGAGNDMHSPFLCAVHEGLTVGALESAGLPGAVRVVPVLDASGPCLVHLNEPPQALDVSVPSASTKEIVP